MAGQRSRAAGEPIFESLEPRLLLDAVDLDAQDHPLAEMLGPPADVTVESSYAPGQVLVRLGPPSEPLGQGDPAGAGLEGLPETLGDLLSAWEVQSASALFPQLQSAWAEGALADDAERADLGRWYSLKLPAGADALEAAAAFAASPAVEFAEPNYEWGLCDEIPTIIEGLPDATTDPGYDNQWHHTNAHIAQAWHYLNTNGVYPGGLRDVVVAVIDSGVDYNHEDLVGNMWVNGGEIPGNLIDDDGNGFVDDIHGCSVVSDGRSHSGDPVDFHGHGTHVAGIIAAQAFNDVGGVGVAFNCQIMAIRAGQYSGILTVEDVAEAVLYATDNGADVINMSFGGYTYSQLVVDALEVALNQAALVAAAGNDAAPLPMFPARLHYVLGVEAGTPKGERAWFSNAGDVRAPGVSIYSTVPGNGYASWSGTSMAAPVVSGIAALMRSYFWQSEIYSSRFNMGSIWASADPNVNAYRALTEPPQPGVWVLDNWLFDDDGIAEGNDGDGRADSGETCHIAVELINRSGMAENVTATLRAHTQGAALDDPYVTIDVGTVSFGNMGPWNTKDNGFIYDAEGVIVGVDEPFVFTVAPDCPNDHVIPFEMTITFQDGWDEEHETYTRVSRFSYIVQRGRNVPTVISEDTELTSEDYWIVGGPVLVESGVTLTIREGAQVQWGAISDDPYNPGPQPGSVLVRGSLVVAGTEDRPVNLFPSYLVSGQEVKITVDGGRCDMSYAEVRNPEMTGINTIDHSYFNWDAYSSTIGANYISNTVFHKMRGTGLSASRFDTCLFGAGQLGPSGTFFVNNVFLQDNENNAPLSVTPSLAFEQTLGRARSPKTGQYDLDLFYNPQVRGNETYVLLTMEKVSLRVAEAVANYYGGHVTSIRDAEEDDFIRSYVASGPKFHNPAVDGYDHFLIGLSDQEKSGTYTWLDGSPMTYTNWKDGYPVPRSHNKAHVVDIYRNGWSWINLDETNGTRSGHGCRMNWYTFILRLPGDWTLAEISEPYETGELLSYVSSPLKKAS